MTCSALRAMRWRPTASDPVKVSLRMRPSASSGSVAASSELTTMFEHAGRKAGLTEDAPEGQ